jgi:hypothetical protein
MRVRKKGLLPTFGLSGRALNAIARHVQPMAEKFKRGHAELYRLNFFSTEDEAIARARTVALELGHFDFPAGTRLHVTNEYGDTIMRIPLVRLHS